MNTVSNSKYGDDFVEGCKLRTIEILNGYLRMDSGMTLKFHRWKRCSSAPGCGRRCMTDGRGMETSKNVRCSGDFGVWHWEVINDEHI